jgi:hypothetical protein
MSTTKKKTVAKATEPKARYENGNRVFICCYVFSGPGLILEGEVRRSDAIKHPMISDNGKIVGSETFFSYIINTAKGEFEVHESNVYPSFFEAAKVFAKSFLVLLK